MVFDPDKYLIRQIKEKDDENAFKVLFETHYQTLYNYARYNINDEDACHDIIQDVFTYLWDKRHVIEIKQTIKSYLLTSTHNACINYLKKQNTKKHHISEFLYGTDKSENGYDPIFENALIENLNNIIDDLPPQCREIFRMSRIKGLKHKEIATKLNISTRTVETQIYRALRAIKKNLNYLVLLFFTFF